MILAESLYPIQHYRQALLVMEWIVVFFVLEWTLIFWIRILNDRTKIDTLQENAYLWLFLGYAVMWIFLILADFYAETPEMRTLFLNIGYNLTTLGVLLFIINMERVKTYIRPYFFSTITIGLSILFILIQFFWIDISYWALRALWVLFLIFWLYDIKDLSLSATFKGKKSIFYIKFTRFLFTISFIVLGFALTTEDSVRFFGLEARVIGDSFQLIGVALVSIYFIFPKPALSDYSWQDHIESIFIMHKSGLFIFKQQLKKTDVLMDETVITGELTTLKMMLESMTERQGGIVIEKSGKTILIFPGQYTTGVFICDKSLRTLKVLLKNIINEIEDLYSSVLKTWKGDTKVFSPIADMIKDKLY